MKTVVTHSGSFHADDVFSIAAFQLLFGKDVKVVRTRDEEVIAQADYVVDVGGVYDPKNNRYDHHQVNAPVRENGIPYSGFGLVWREYGVEVCKSEVVATAIEKSLVQAVDAGDNGINLYDLRNKETAPYELYQVVGSFAPVWGSTESKDEAFLEAVEFARGLLSRIIGQKQSEQKMLELVKDVYESAPDKRVLVFDVPVTSTACIQYPEVLLSVCPDDTTANSNWVATAVRKEYGTFENRINFPEAWGGLRNEELARVSGIEDAVFCHKARFCFVTGSKEGVLKGVEETLG